MKQLLFFISLTIQQSLLQNMNLVDIASPLLLNQLTSNPNLLRNFVDFAVPGDQSSKNNFYRLPFQNKVNSTRKQVKETADQCSCSTVLNPVCGNDRKTYLNECTALCNNKQVLYYSACVEDLDQNLQPNLNDPDLDFNPNNDDDRFIDFDDIDYSLYYPINPYYATLKCKNCPKETSLVCANVKLSVEDQEQKVLVLVINFINMNSNDEMNDYIAKEYMTNTIPAISDFIKIPNQSREFDPEWKTNGVQQKVCQYVVDWVNKQGLQNMTVEILNEQDRTPAVLIIIDEFNAKQSRNVLMYGHLDKQPPLTEKWSEGLAPYDPVIKNGKLYGRGGVDDGYAIFCCVLLVKALQKFNKSHNRLILFFETDEESGSQDLKYYLQQKMEVIGELSLIICLDSGAYNYERFCLTTALRGVMNFTIKCELTEESYDSEVFGNVLPDPYRILRAALQDFENIKTGKVLDDFYVDIPEQNMQQCKDFVKELDGKVDFDMPILDGVDYMSKDPLELILNNVWRPSLTLIGADEIPYLPEGGSQIRKGTALRMSLRLPPTLDTDKAKEAMTNFFVNYPVENGVKITVEEVINGNGFAAPPFKQTYLDIVSKNAKNIFEKEMLFLGVGGSIPFMNEFFKVYPQAQFFITGMVGPGASIHAPDECLDIEYGKKFFQTLTGFITDLAGLVEEQIIY